jgi:hypothetical protein
MQDDFEGMLDDSGRVHFHTMCPHGHATIQAFTPMELRYGLDDESLTFQCLSCGAEWKPTAMQRGLILAEFDL